ncbi:MAG: hypothetical protein AB8I08_22020 [Sandaracinaceae bacterium]
MTKLSWFSCIGALALLVVVGCDTPVVPDAGLEPPRILTVEAPDPAVEGSVLLARGLGFRQLGESPRMAVRRGGELLGNLSNVPDDEDGQYLFELDAVTIGQLGPGRHDVEVQIEGDGATSSSFPFELRVVSNIPVELLDAPRGEVFNNEVATVIGNGILGMSEGTLVAQFTGTYTFDAGGSTDVDATLPVAPLERGDRERGVVVLTTDIGGQMPGTFEGTVALESTLRSGERSESMPVTTNLHFNGPELFGLTPQDASVGQILTISGAGFLGGDDREDELTLLRIEGMFTPAGGGSPESFSEEIVPRWVSGQAVELLVEPEIRDDQLISQLFGHARGTFAGQATPITVVGTEELTGATIPFGFSLGSVVQVVYVRFLPGFYASLARFGLASAAPQIEDRVRERMEEIYIAWNVDVRFEEPTDFSPNAYATVEIGGTDPNGVGLFGYDNTPGKDIGNVRLFDRIGGANAETQADGYPGFGGVFMESFLYWSSHPELPGEPRGGAPDPIPLFEEIFDPVRAQAATRAEASGEGDPDRVGAVEDAVRALGSIIGETTSHELGHRLGMAQPYGSPTTYHNDFDGPGCVMDSGRDRPLDERMALSGAAPSQFCYDHPSYLSEILGR